MQGRFIILAFFWVRKFCRADLVVLCETVSALNVRNSFHTIHPHPIPFQFHLTQLIPARP